MEEKGVLNIKKICPKGLDDSPMALEQSNGTTMALRVWWWWLSALLVIWWWSSDLLVIVVVGLGLAAGHHRGHRDGCWFHHRVGSWSSLLVWCCSCGCGLLVIVVMARVVVVVRCSLLIVVVLVIGAPAAGVVLVIGSWSAAAHCRGAAAHRRVGSAAARLGSRIIGSAAARGCQLGCSTMQQ